MHWHMPEVSVPDVPESLKQNYDSTSSNPMADQLAQKGIDQVKQDTKSYPL